MIHGQYCKSGTASMKLKKVTTVVDGENVDSYVFPTNTDPEARLAVCLTFESTIHTTTDPDALDGTPIETPYQCTPDGNTYCLYKKQGQTYFKLLCECGL